MTFRITHKYDNDTHEAQFNIGSYVRAVGRDNGTGLVVAINDGSVLDEKTNKVYRQRVYQVHWLDIKDATGNTVYAFHAESELASSSRSVPKFSSAEEAEAWMEQQVEPGNWTGSAQDAADSASDLDIALQKILEEGQTDD
jgi:hypothetical protein